MPSLATAFDVARLYDELRECVRANDQEGVSRVFGELDLDGLFGMSVRSSGVEASTVKLQW